MPHRFFPAAALAAGACLLTAACGSTGHPTQSTPAKSGSALFTMGPRLQGNTTYFVGHLVDGTPMLPHGAVITGVHNTTRGSKGQYPDDITMVLSHETYPTGQQALGGYGSVAALTHAFDNQPAAGDWGATLNGFDKETANPYAAITIDWKVP